MFATRQTILLVEGNFSIYNYSSVTFTNITFKFIQSNINNKDHN